MERRKFLFSAGLSVASLAVMRNKALHLCWTIQIQNETTTQQHRYFY